MMSSFETGGCNSRSYALARSNSITMDAGSAPVLTNVHGGITDRVRFISPSPLLFAPPAHPLAPNRPARPVGESHALHRRLDDSLIDFPRTQSEKSQSEAKSLFDLCETTLTLPAAAVR